MHQKNSGQAFLGTLVNGGMEPKEYTSSASPFEPGGKKLGIICPSH